MKDEPDFLMGKGYKAPEEGQRASGKVQQLKAREADRDWLGSDSQSMSEFRYLS